MYYSVLIPEPDVSKKETGPFYYEFTMISGITDILSSFRPVGLDKLDKVRLMDRVDTKYILPVYKIPEFLERLDGDGRVLEINGERIFDYHTVYLDTSDYSFFNQHVTGRTGRSKVRYRTYVNSGITFLEVKMRKDGNRTIKWRIENSLTSENKCDNEGLEFLSRHIPGEKLSISPVISNEFRRVTFVNPEFNERMTLDFNLSYGSNGPTRFNIPGLAILELKKYSGLSRSKATAILKDMGLHPTGFSKYCVGVAVLCNPPKKNIIKTKLLLINKIENEYSSRHIY